MQIPDSELSLTKLIRLPCESFILKCLENFEKITGLQKSFCQSISESLHICFIPAQNFSLILFFNCFVMITNEGPIACESFE